VHTHDPQTLAWALNDSPAGLAAWIVERRRAWSDCDGDVESRFSKDDLLTTASIYWFTRTFHTSARIYADTRRARPAPVHDRVPELEAPTAIAVFPQDVIQYPRAVADRHANLQQWTVMPRGGHFAPMEEPDRLVDDVRRFFRRFR
jgi:pimeloyl-ACP methyl ester carboxylesterase